MSKIVKSYFNMQNRKNNMGEIFIDGVIESEVLDTQGASEIFSNELKALGNIKYLDIHINSPGGNVFEGQAIYSILKRHNAQVTVYIDGLAASIASVIAMAGDIIIMPSNSLIMIHEPWTLALGNSRDLNKMADTLDKINESIVNTYINKTAGKITEDYIRLLMKAETWLSAEEAVRYGFADSVSEAKGSQASINREYASRYKNVPKNILKVQNVKNSKKIAYKELLDSIVN